MPTPATYTVETTDNYTSLDGKDRRKFKTGAVIDYQDAIKFGMVAAPAALPPLYGSVRFDPSMFSVDDDAVVTTTGGIGGASITIPYSIPGGSTQMNISGPVSGAEIDLVTDTDPDNYSNPAWESLVDLTGMTDARLIGRVAAAGPTDAYLAFKYSPDNLADYADLVSGGLSAAIDAEGWFDTGWQTLVAGSKAIIYLHPFTAHGDAYGTTAQVQPMYLQFK